MSENKLWLRNRTKLFITGLQFNNSEEEPGLQLVDIISNIVY